MNVEERIEAIKKRQSQNKRLLSNAAKITTVSLILGASGLNTEALAQERPQKDNDPQKPDTTLIMNSSQLQNADAAQDTATFVWDGSELPAEDNSIKHYLHIEEIPSLDAIYNSPRPAGKYIDGIGVVYTQYRINNPTDTERQLIDNINKQNYSASVARHEKTHALMADVRDKLYDGTLFTTASDRVRAEILAELICFKEGDQKSAQETIQDFEKKHLDDYIRNYDSNLGSIVLALSAEEIIPETTYEIFERSESGWQEISIDSTSYCIWQYASEDGKYKTSVLHETAGDEPVVSADILAKSPVEIGILYNADGSAVLSPDGKKIHSFYSSWAGDGDKHVLGGIPNTDKKVQGYSYTKAQENYQTYVNELWNAIDDNTSVTEDDFEAFQTFAASQDLSGIGKTDEEIKEIRDTYKNMTLEQEQNKMQQRYKTIKKDHTDQKLAEIAESMNKDVSAWVEVADPSAQQAVRNENKQEKASDVSSEKPAKPAKKGFAKIFQAKGKSL